MSKVMKNFFALTHSSGGVCSMCRLSWKLMVDDAFWIHSQCTETDEVIGVLITRKGF